jgi:hypothetical protein
MFLIAREAAPVATPSATACGSSTLQQPMFLIAFALEAAFRRATVVGLEMTTRPLSSKLISSSEMSSSLLAISVLLGESFAILDGVKLAD